MILIIHMSDMHIGSGNIPKPHEAITSAIRGLVDEISSVIVAISGDVAYSGKSHEYEDALEYFSTLKNTIESEHSCDCHIVACPGNHDCEFSDDDAMRSLAIKDIRKRSNLPDSPSVVEECLRVQSNFNDWANCLEGEINRGIAHSRVCKCKDDVKIGFRVVNSAWMSLLTEKQGTLYFPISELPSLSSDIRITVMHHPYAWFESSNGRELRRALEDGSDIILTGHEHDIDSYSVDRSELNRTGYIEGGAFNGEVGDAPRFLVVRVDITNRRYSVVHFRWHDDMFTRENAEDQWDEFISQVGQGAREQKLSEDILKFIEDPGLQLTHRAKTLLLEDIFIVPELRTYTNTDKASLPVKAIPSGLTINTLFSNKYAYILGEGQCGKTALCKSLYKHSIQRGLLPVLLMNGHQLKPDTHKLKKQIDTIVSMQYRSMTPEKFWQSKNADRVIIVDGFSEIELNTKGIDVISKWLKNKFGRVYLFGDDMTQIESLVSMPENDGGLEGYSRYEICPFGHELRDVLITRWLMLGREYEVSESEIQHQVRKAASFVNTVLGKNLLPAFPMHILLILQQMEASTPLSTSSGSYGYFYESVLTRALSITSDSPEDLDAKYTYLSELSWYMIQEGVQEIDEASLALFTGKHCERYQLLKSPDQFRNEVTRSRIIYQFYGNYRFAYKCFKFYFVARYLRDNKETDQCIELLEDAVENLHREDYANIIIFYTYLTKDKSIINSVLNTGRQLYGGIEACNLENHIDFVNRIQKCIPEVVLPESEPQEQRRALLRKIDETEKQDSNQPQVQESDEQELEALLEMNRAIKTLQVLGQILRNFSGSLPSEIKNSITQECFGIGLRVLNNFYISIENNLDASLTVLADLFGRDFSELPERQRVDAAKQFVFFIAELLCLTTLSRISNSIGSEKLLRTYEDIDTIHSNRATRFVQLALRLDHCLHFPEKLVTELYEEVKDDVFGLTLLKLIIAQHFHFASRPYRIRQRICGLLGISYTGTTVAQGKLTTIANKRLK